MFPVLASVSFWQDRKLLGDFVVCTEAVRCCTRGWLCLWADTGSEGELGGEGLCWFSLLCSASSTCKWWPWEEVWSPRSSLQALWLFGRPSSLPEFRSDLMKCLDPIFTVAAAEVESQLRADVTCSPRNLWLSALSVPLVMRGRVLPVSLEIWGPCICEWIC